jgi:hypothetical protein
MQKDFCLVSKFCLQLLVARCTYDMKMVQLLCERKGRVKKASPQKPNCVGSLRITLMDVPEKLRTVRLPMERRICKYHLTNIERLCK